MRYKQPLLKQNDDTKCFLRLGSSYPSLEWKKKLKKKGNSLAVLLVRTQR